MQGWIGKIPLAKMRIHKWNTVVMTTRHAFPAVITKNHLLVHTVLAHAVLKRRFFVLLVTCPTLGKHFRMAVGTGGSLKITTTPALQMKTNLIVRHEHLPFERKLHEPRLCVLQGHGVLLPELLGDVSTLYVERERCDERHLGRQHMYVARETTGALLVATIVVVVEHRHTIRVTRVGRVYPMVHGETSVYSFKCEAVGP